MCLVHHRHQTHKRKRNAVVDMLSRHILATSLGVDFSMLAHDQKTDMDIELLLGSETRLTFQEVELSPGIKVICDTSRGEPRPIVPNLGKRTFCART